MKMKITIDLPDYIVEEIESALGATKFETVREWIEFDINARYNEISDNAGFEVEVDLSYDEFSAE
jgi:uncharacterized ubiquitin-like protein YukD